MSRCSEWPFSVRFLNQNFVYISRIPIRAKCPAHLINFDFNIVISFGEQYSLLKLSLFLINDRMK